MTTSKSKLSPEQIEVLVTHLRGEVGEIVTSWTFMREYIVQLSASNSGADKLDLQNPAHSRLMYLRAKFADDIIGRLSELAQQKKGRTNFAAAARVYPHLLERCKAFEKYLKDHQFHVRRNTEISHKQLPSHWRNRVSPPEIEYRILIRAVAFALSLVKAIDQEQLGPASTYLWHEMRKKRYALLFPARLAYWLMPYFHLAPETRFKILRAEIQAGQEVWEPMDTSINGKKAKVLACKRWGIIRIGKQLTAFDKYPLIELNEITVS